jgi:hypothetical protein
MQTLIQVVCTKGKSLRDAIVNDPKREEDFRVDKEREPGRSPGWAKLLSNRHNRQGALNIQWDAKTSILLCRIVNKGAGKANLIVGDFVDYLLAQHCKRIEVVTIIPPR